jgi:hypothetical protein
MPENAIDIDPEQRRQQQYEEWQANSRFAPGDIDYQNSLANRMNPVAGETAPKYWTPVATTTYDKQIKDYESGANNPYSAANIAKQQYTDSHPQSMEDWYNERKDLPTTVYGNRDGRFVETNDSGGRGGQWVGGFVQLGGSKSQGPSF